jgi:thiol-disulfide isomerase/thioredoxin
MLSIKHILLLLIGFATLNNAISQSNNTPIPDFTLLNVVTSQQVSLSDYSNSKAIVVVFMSNDCPYAKLYEQRILNLYTKYSNDNITFLLINSNNSSLTDVDNVMRMKIKAGKVGYPFPYLADKENLVMNIFKAEKTPEVFVLSKNKNELITFYHGAIDDSPQAADLAKSKYIELALNNILKDKPAPIQYKRPVGCRIKTD